MPTQHPVIAAAVALTLTLPLCFTPRAAAQVLDFRDVGSGAAREQQQPALPTPQEIIERHIEATGGRAAYERIHNRRLVGTLHQAPQDRTIAITINRAAPNNQHVLLGSGQVYVTNADESWTYDGDVVVASGGDQRAQQIRRAAFNGVFDWERHYELARTLGEEPVDGRPAYKVRLTAEDCHKVYLYFDKATGRHVRTVEDIAFAGDTIPADARFSDYRVVDGVAVPMTLVRVLMYRGSRMVQTYDLTSVEHNVPMPESLFETPFELRDGAADG